MGPGQPRCGLAGEFYKKLISFIRQEEVRNPPYLYSFRMLIPFMSQVSLYCRLNQLVKGRLLAILAMQVKDRQEKIGWMEEEHKMTELLVGHSRWEEFGKGYGRGGEVGRDEQGGVGQGVVSC